jgi:hypothetical protein
MSIEQRPEGMSITAPRFAWAGLQQHAAGSFRVDIRYTEGGFDCDIQATLGERIKGTAVVLRDRMPAHIPTPDYAREPCPSGMLLRYPMRLHLPVFPHTKGADRCITSAGRSGRCQNSLGCGRTRSPFHQV